MVYLQNWLQAQQALFNASVLQGEKGKGMETGVLYSHQHWKITATVLCMTCLKACPHRSVELNASPN